ncbi:autotransporter outer membrane beta-barrel domain-containing protein [Bartonella sp. AA97HXZ]|uniref:autotransporter outer membrane beta-barrel domain-containing protein n=7 Tax=Bartonella TaxID=773 RepID=UPI0035CF6F24
MTGGSITASKVGAFFLDSKSKENELKDVVTSSGKDDAPLINGIKATNSNVTLNNVTVTQAQTAIDAYDSTVKVLGGSFDAEKAAIFAQNGGNITLTGGAKITSYNDAGLYAEGSKSIIEMTGGSITAKEEAVTTTYGGHITVTDVTLKTNGDGLGVASDDLGSMIELLGKTTISDSAIGLQAQNGGVIKMTGGTITASAAGAGFLNSNSRENKLENVTISSGKDDAPLNFGIKADKGTVTLKDVTVTQAAAGIFADHDSTITISGGSFHAQNATISAQNGSAITLTNGAKITSSDDVGLYAKDSNSSITMIEGNVTGKASALVAEDGGHITVTDVTLKTNDSDKSFGVFSNGANSVIELLGKTTISGSAIGLAFQNDGAIKMIGGTITASAAGAGFLNSNSHENKLENVTISSDKDDTPLNFGIKADKSTVTLKDVTVTQAAAGIFAENDSTITISGGSFHAQNTTISAKSGSTITLTNDANITSSDNVGLYAEGSKSTITMTGGTVTGKGNALVAENGGHITVADVALTVTDVAPSDDYISSGVFSVGEGSVIELLGNTTISNSALGLQALNDGAIKMTGGAIKTSLVGAGFLNSNSGENKLEGVKISNNKDDALLNFGIKADKSTVTLKDVTVTQAAASIVANNHSTITVSGGSFSGRAVGGSAETSSTIILKNNANIISSNGEGLLADGSGSKIIMTGGSVAANKTALFALNGGHIDATDVALTTEGKGSGAFVSGNDSTIQLHGDTIINNTLDGLGAVNGGKIISENLSIIGGEALEGSDNERTGIWTSDSGSEVRLMGKTTIQNVDEGFYADGGSKIISGDLTITGGESKQQTVAVNVAELGSAIELNGKTIIQNFDFGLTAANNSTIKMTNGYIGAAENTIKNKIEAKKVALWAAFNGHIDVVNTSMIAGVAGLQFIALSNPDLDYPDDPQKRKSSEINLTNAELHAENGTGIFVGAFTKNNIENSADLSIGTVNLTNSGIHADVLLGDGLFTKEKSFWEEEDIKAISNGTFTLSADQSTLEGRANIAKNRTVRFDLKNKTTWTLKTSTKEKDADGNLLDIAQRSRSDISTLNLDNSSIVFDGLVEDHYHTLHIGSGKPDTQTVYNATGDAKIYFNIAWSDGVASADQKTDRLLIHGDVSGSTTVYIKSDSGDESSVVNAADPSNIGGLSLIQVSGKAQEDSFKLVNGYTTRNRLPYKYTLTAYGPESSHGTADVAQSLFDEKNENFWDFRLHKEILETDSGSGPSVIVPVAQTASYLVMPNALFYSGLTDMAKQNALLGNIRTSVLGKEEEKQTGFFLYTYGNTGTLSSERGPLKYGYGADIRYAALQAAVTFAALEGQNTTTHFGLVGTYGRLSFTPKDMDDVSKSTLDKWSLTAYGSVQHDNGFYMDTLLSYGIIKGDIGNAIIGKTAKLKNAKMLSISTTVGKEFAAGMEGLTFEPQAQIAYQHLMFNTIEDADNFTVDMKNPSQWLIRVGGRLTKTISTENNRPMSFYGKVNLIKTFGDNGTIQIGRDFDLDPMGPAIEGGVGINAQLSHNFSLHGDVSYQQKLQKTGISGASFSGGIRYQF